MVFSSIIFIYTFLPCCLVGYYIFCRNNIKRKNHFLLWCSLLFYAWGGIKYLLLMLFSIVTNWFIAEKIRKKKHQRWLLVLDITVNLLMLFVFKYLNFTVDNINALFGSNIVMRKIVLPLGISFFTFQAMSYVIDVYRGDTEPLGSVLDVGLYISLFPQLVAGPIVRYSDIKEQIYGRTESYELFAEGIYSFAIGLGKKVLLANQLAIISEKAFGLELRSVPMAWLGAVAYTLQIYFDFSGYSDMAIGLGKMFGFKFNKNFDYPYISTSITEFWRRWHISMGTWFRDYVYFPLGGSRVKSKFRIIFNLFIVWLLTGIWHGANWTFIIWGMLQFVCIASEKLTGLNKHKHFYSKMIGLIFSLLIVMLGWVFFNSSSIADALHFIGTMFGVGNVAIEPELCGLLKNNILVLAFSVVFCTPVLNKFYSIIKNERALTIFKLVFASFIFILGSVYIAKGSYNPFIYFNF